MKPLGILSMAMQFVPRFLEIRRGTWIALGLGLLTLFILLIWASVALLGWVWGQGKALGTGAPDAVRVVVEQVEQAVPGARAVLGDWLPALKPEPAPRDVSGTDVGPVARYPGLMRSHWQHEGREIMVRYEGRADYVAVLEHYTRAFAAQGYAHKVVSATPADEEHDYRKGDERIRFMIAQLPEGKVQATIVAVLPSPTF